MTEQLKTRIRVVLNRTARNKAQPEHAVMAILDDSESHLARCCTALKTGLKTTSLRDNLIIRDSNETTARPIDEWSDTLISDRFQACLRKMESATDWAASDDARRDRLFTAEMVAGMRSSFDGTLSAVGIDRAQLVDMLRRAPVQRQADAAVFLPDGTLNLKAFDRSAQSILRLVETEARGLGLERIVSSLLLFGFVSPDDGLLATGLRLQAPTVKLAQFREILARKVRQLGTGRLNEHVALHRDRMQSSLNSTFDAAAEQADMVEATVIGESELLKAFLLAGDHSVDSFLRDQKVNQKELSSYLAHHHALDVVEADDEEEPLLPIDEVDSYLRSTVLGQNHAVDAVMPMIKRLRFGYLRQGRPAGVLLLLGMSGTGKTALAKAIAHAVYGSQENLIFLEMGQFGSEHSKTAFVGAPPGLVGYGEGILTNGLRDKPQSVVLFDEVEKAHKSVFDVVLRFLDEGQIADAAGAVRDGRNCLIVLTSNLAVRELAPLIREQSAAAHMTALDREHMRKKVRQQLEHIEFFRPEFLNRVDELILFNEITGAVYQQIIEHQLNVEQRRLLAEKNLKIDFDPAIAGMIAARCAERSSEGARVCGRMVSEMIITPLIDFFLCRDNHDVTSARVVLGGDGQITIRRREA